MKIKKFKNSLKIRKLKIGKLRLRTYISLGLIIVLLPIVIFSLFSASDSEAAWFDLSWGFRKRIPVTNSSGSNQTDFQVLITIDSASLITASKMQNDCDDLLITDINGNLLPQWIEPNTCNTTETLVWVKVPTVHTSGTDLYVYYGNPSAAAAASGTDNVFIRDMESAVAAWPMQETDVNTSYTEAKHPGVDEGRDIVINGGFDSDTVWSKNGSVSIANGVGIYTATSTSNGFYSSTFPIIIGKTYEVTYTISNYSSGAMRVLVGSGGVGTTRSANGTYTETLTAATDTALRFYATTTNTTLHIDNVSVKQVDTSSSADFDGTNLLNDGDMEAADTSAWVSYAGGTYSKETLNPHGGTRVLRTQSDDDDHVAGARQSILATGHTYRATGYVRSDGTVTPTLTTDGGANVFWTGSTSTNWQYFDATFTTTTSYFTVRVVGGTVANYAEWDDVSVTEISPLSGSIPTAASGNRPTVNTAAGGHLSKAYSFDGSNDYVNIYSSDLNSVFNPDEGTLVAWAKVSDAGVWSDNTYRSIIFLGAEQGNNKVRLYKSSSNDLYTSYEGPDGTEKTVATSTSTTDWFLLIGTWDTSGELKLYLNGIEVGTPSTGLSAIVKNFDSNDVAIGSNYTGSPNNPWSGLINDVRLYDRALSADEIASLYSASADIQAYYTDNYEGHELVRKYDAGVAIGTLAAEEVGPDPVAEWKFDEGQGQEAKDSSSNGNDGQLGSTSSTDANDPTWVPEDRCISGKCLEFDGGGDYVDIDSDPSIQMKESMTVSVWFKTDAGVTTTHDIISKYVFGSTKGYRIYYESNSLIFKISDTSNYPADTISFTPDGRWHHVVGIRDVDTDTVTLYLDGNSSGSPNSDTTSGDLSSSQDLSIGVYSSRSTNFFNGFIDEVRIYPYARTAAQIKADYNQGAAKIGAPDQGALSDGLVGYWTMDETSGTTVADKSGNGNDGTLTNAQETGTSDATSSTTTLVDTDGTLSDTDDAYNGMILSVPAATCAGLSSDQERLISDYTGSTNTITVSTAFSGDLDACTYTILHQVGGKFGSGVRFEKDDYVQIQNEENFDFDINNSFSISSWIKAQDITSTYGQIFYKSVGTTQSGYFLRRQGQKIRLNFSGASEQLGNVITNNVITENEKWYFVTATYDGSENLRGAKIYINGTLSASGSEADFSGSILNDTAPRISYGLSTAEGFTGSIDETRIYNRALSPSEVKQLYEWAPGPVGYWNFEEGSGDTAFDRSGNGNSGSLGADPSTPSWTSGKYGKALEFDGSDYVSLTSSLGLLRNHTINAWVKQDSDQTGFQSIVGNDTNNYGLTIEDGDTLWYKAENNANSNSATINPNTWYYLSIVRNGTDIAYYRDGIEIGTNTIAEYPILTVNKIGNMSTSSSYNFNGDIDDVKIYNYARTPEQIRQDMMGSGQSTAAGADPLPQPVAHWSFDEMQGQTANDKVGGNNGTLGADDNPGTDDPTWTSSGKVNGALSFDGADYTKIADNSTLDLIDNLSVSGWIKPNDVSGKKTIIVKGGENWAYVNYQTYLSSDELCIRWYNSGFETAHCTTSANIAAGSWTHFSIALDNTTSTLKIYINGNQEYSGAITKERLVSDRLVAIGADPGDGATYVNFFDGQIDEVKIYNSALSAEQVRQDMNAGSTLAFGGVAGNSEAADMTDGAGDPPIAYWDFEEKSGSTLHDKSGNGNDGDITGAIWKSGCKYGACLEFDGNDRTTFTDIDLGTTHSISVWFKPSNTGGNQAVLGGQSSAPQSYGLLASSGTTLYYKTQDISVGISYAYTTGNWYHVEIVRTGTTVKWYVNGQHLETDTLSSNLSLSINTHGALSNGGAGYYGSIDSVKVYDYARTPAQIAYDYNRGAPIAHWKFNECEGSTIHDSSGNGNHGTLTVTTDGGNSAGVGTCNTGSSAWGSGATGKFGSSLNFDGDGDYVDIYSSELNSAFNSDEGTVSLWTKIPSSAWTDSTLRRPLTIGADTYANYIAFSKDSASNSISWRYEAGDVPLDVTKTNVSTTDWFHVVLTWSSANDEVKAYYNGIQEGSTQTGLGTWSGNLHTSACVIGAVNTTPLQPWGGQIDDVQIFNYALSPAQVRKLYNGGAAVKFGE